MVPPETSATVPNAAPGPTFNVAPVSSNVPVTFTVPPVLVTDPSCANVKLPPRPRVAALTVIVPAFDQPVELIDSVAPLATLTLPPAELVKPVAVILTVSLFEAAIVPWLVRLELPRVNVP